MASARDNSTMSTSSNTIGVSTETRQQTITEISTNTASINLRDSESQIDRPTMLTSMAQAKPHTDTAMASARPIMEEAATSITIDGKDFSTQAQTAGTMVSNDYGMNTESTSMTTTGSMTSPTRKNNATSQFHSTTNSSSTMTAPKVRDGGTSPMMAGGTTTHTQYESTTVSRSMNTRN